MYGWLVTRFWFVCDDAFISFRYARHWAAGEGLVYNPAAEIPVEGYSNFLWVAISALVERCGGDLVFVVPCLSVLCGAWLLTLVFRTCEERTGGNTEAAFLATATLAAFPPFALWASSGLETMPFALLFFLTHRALHTTAHPAPGKALVAALPMALIRLEGIAWALVLGLLVRLGVRDRLMHFGKYSLPLVGGYLIYWWWRWDYYGLPLPNTAYAKSGMNPQTLVRGLDYVVVFLLTFLTPLQLVWTGWAAWRGKSQGTPATILVILGVHIYAILVGGDFMSMGRFLVPAFALQAVLLGQALASRRTSLAPRVMAAVFLLLGLLPGFDVHLVPESIRARFHFRHNTTAYRSEYQQWKFMKSNSHDLAILGQALAQVSDSEDSMVFGAIGAVGYYSGLHIYDKIGLVNREVASLPWDGELHSPGHDKVVEWDYFLPQHPTYLFSMLLHEPSGRPAARERKAAKNRSMATNWMEYWRQHSAYFEYLPASYLIPHERGRSLLVVLRKCPPAERGLDPSIEWNREVRELVRKLTELEASPG